MGFDWEVLTALLAALHFGALQRAVIAPPRFRILNRMWYGVLPIIVRKAGYLGIGGLAAVATAPSSNRITFCSLTQ